MYGNHNKVLQTKFVFANNFFLTYIPFFFGQKCGSTSRAYTFGTLVLKMNISFQTMNFGPEKEFVHLHESWF